MRRLIRPLAVTVAVVGLMAAPGAAVANTHHHRHHARPLGLVPAKVFLPRAARANEFEIVTGQLAQQRARSQTVRDLGAMFVTDHTALLAQGAQVAQQLGVTAPPQLNRRQQAVVTRLQHLNGAAFDSAWLRAQLAAHVSAVALNLAGAIRGGNDAIRTLAQGALPIVTKHLGELLDLSRARYAARHGHR
jgi:predicted outer membrane protein